MLTKRPRQIVVLLTLLVLLPYRYGPEAVAGRHEQVGPASDARTDQRLRLLHARLAQMYAVADFDGDGVADLAAVDFLSDTLSTLLSDSAGNLRLAAKTSTDRGPRSIVAADFDRDGMVDLAVSSFLSGSVQLFKGVGNGHFTLLRRVDVGVGAMSVVSDDFDADGLSDLAFANVLSGEVSLLRNTGSGVFDRALTLGDAESASLILPHDADRDAPGPGLSVIDLEGLEAGIFRALGGGAFADLAPIDVVSALAAAIDDDGIDAGRVSAILLAAGVPVGSLTLSVVPVAEQAEAIGALESLMASVDRLETQTSSGGDETRAIRTASNRLRRSINQILLGYGTDDAPVVGAAGSDLEETAVGNPPAVVVLKQKFSVTDTVQNHGVAAGETTTRYYFSLDSVLSSGDKRLSGKRVVPGLASGASSMGTVNVTVPVSIKVGFYFLIACADDLEVEAETNESNNCRASATTVEVRAADLIESAVNNPPASASPGDSFSATDTVVNQGNAQAGMSTTRYRLSLDTKKSANDLLLASTRAIPTLAPQASSMGTVTVTIPQTAAPGMYHLLACSDDLKKVPESNEKNNCKASATKVTIGSPPPGDDVSIIDFAFVPQMLTVPVGTNVTWTNNGSFTHTSTSTSGGGLWDSGNIAPGGTFSRTFNSVGSFPYRCNIHLGMTGTIVVQ